jgi:hypothetical protein
MLILISAFGLIMCERTWKWWVKLRILRHGHSIRFCALSALIGGALVAWYGVAHGACIALRKEVVQVEGEDTVTSFGDSIQ